MYFRTGMWENLNFVVSEKGIANYAKTCDNVSQNLKSNGFISKEDI